MFDLWTPASITITVLLSLIALGVLLLCAWIAHEMKIHSEAHEWKGTTVFILLGLLLIFTGMIVGSSPGVSGFFARWWSYAGIIAETRVPVATPDEKLVTWDAKNRQLTFGDAPAGMQWGYHTGDGEPKLPVVDKATQKGEAKIEDGIESVEVYYIRKIDWRPSPPITIETK